MMSIRRHKSGNEPQETLKRDDNSVAGADRIHARTHRLDDFRRLMTDHVAALIIG